MTAHEQGSNRRRVLRMVLAGFVSLTVALAAWLLIERQRGKAALAKYEKELIANGEKLTFLELVPPIPEGENKAAELLRLCKSLQFGTTLVLNAPPAMRLVAPAKAMVVAKQQNWSVGDEKKVFAWEDGEPDLKANSATLAELRRAAGSPVLRNNINYQGAATRFTPLAPHKSAAQWLSVSALYNLHARDVKAAVDDVEAIILFSRILGEEPHLISQLVRNAIVAIAVHDCWPILQADDISEEHLSRLQRLLESLDLVNPMGHALRGERVMYRDMIHKLRAAETSFEELSDTLASILGDDEEKSGLMEKVPYREEIRDIIGAAIIAPTWRYVWSYEDERRLLAQVQAELTAADRARAQRSVVSLKRGTEESKYSGRYRASSTLMPALAKAPLRAFRYEAHREMTVAAIAVKRYQLRHGRYPEHLHELVPKFLREHPVDWMDGQKLRYRREGSSFVLWSVGDNGVDDGATPDQIEPYNFLSSSDIVWPQPASDAEVEAHKAKIRPKR